MEVDWFEGKGAVSRRPAELNPSPRSKPLGRSAGRAGKDAENASRRNAPLGRARGKSGKDAGSVAYRSSIDGIADRPARERPRTPHDAVHRAS
jgi:hypothetical protein